MWFAMLMLWVGVTNNCFDVLFFTNTHIFFVLIIYANCLLKKLWLHGSVSTCQGLEVILNLHDSK